MSDEMSEIWALYADDGAQALQATEDALIQLKTGASDRSTIAALFRSLHTFKGNSRLLGLTVIESRAHIAEDMVGLVRDEGVKLDAEMLELLFEVTDALRGMMDEAVASRVDADEAPTADLIARMKSKFDRSRPIEGEPLSSNEERAISCEDHEMDNGADSEAEPEAVVDPEAVAESDSSIGAPTRGGRLGDDPLYFEIFLDLVGHTLIDVEAALAASPDGAQEAKNAAKDAVMRLGESAERIELDDWAAAAAAMVDSFDAPERAVLELERLRLMHSEGLRRLSPIPVTEGVSSTKLVADLVDAQATQQKDTFFDQIAPLLATLASAGGQIFHITPELAEATKKLVDAASVAGYDRLAEAASSALSARDADSFNAALFDLYHILTLVGDDADLGLETPHAGVRPFEPLAAWCETKAAETLGKLALAINGRPARELDWEEIGELVRNLWCICHARRLDTANHVASALQDLVARVRSGEMSPDPPLLRILFSFIEAGKPLLLDGGTRSGDVSAEELLRLTSESMSRFCGQEDGLAVTSKLNLPASFIGVLSRESLASIQQALSGGQNLFIVRADTERYPEAQAAFFEWLTKDAKPLASVTVFEGNSTQFDFLVATALSEAQVKTALSVMDPSGDAFSFQARVGFSAEASPQALASAQLEDHDSIEKKRQTSANILESVGEIITAHATLRQILLRSLDDEGLHNVERLLRAGDLRSEDDSIAVQAVQNWKGNIEQLLALEDQIASNLEHLQREFVASRLLSSGGMLARLEGAATERAIDEGIELTVSRIGADEWVDADILDQLDASSGALLKLAFDEMLALRAPGVPAYCDLSFKLDKTDKRVSLSVESRFVGRDEQENAYPVGDDMTRAARALRARGGDFQRRRLPEGQGICYVVSAPQTMAVLDGMIVRVGAINYVVPVQSVERIVHASSTATRRISAENGRSMLRIDSETMAPIIHLCRESRTEGANSGVVARTELEDEKGLFVIANDEGRLAALPVDELLGQQPLLVRPLKGYLSSIPSVNGCAPLGDGGVGMVINPAALFQPPESGLRGRAIAEAG